MKVTGQSKIEFHKLHSSSQPNDHNLFKLTRVDTDERILVDKNLIELVNQLNKGVTVQEAAKEIKFSVHVVLVMLKVLEDAHFFKSIDGIPFDNTLKKSKLIITGHSKIEFYKLRMGADPDEHNLYGLVRWDTDDTLKVDKNVIELVKLLSEGKTVQEAAHEIKFALDVVLLLLKLLEESHFFKSVDGEQLDDTGTKIKPWLATVDKKWFRWMVSKYFIYPVLAISITGIIMGFIVNGIPSYKSFFWTPDIFVVFVSLFIADIFLITAHELAHFLATKAVGGEAVMRLSYRYIYIVAETESYHLGVVPKRERYLVYLAGTFMDLFIVGTIYWFLIAAKLLNIELGSAYNFFIAVILINFMGTLWLFDVFLETDMYNFLSEYLGMENLRNDALKYITLHTKRWKRVLLFPVKRVLLLFPKNYADTSDDLRLLSKSERRKLFIYVFVLIIGMMLTSLEFIFYTIPRDYTYLAAAVRDLLLAVKNVDITSFSRSSGMIITALVIPLLKSGAIIVIVLFNYVLLILLKNKEIIRRHTKYNK